MSQKLGLLAVLSLTVCNPMHATANAGREVGVKESDRGFDVQRLKSLDGPALTPEKRAQRGLSFYREELQHPTPRLRPPYTGFKTHDYVLARITRKLVESSADRVTLQKTREKEEAGELQDCLTLVLLWTAPGPGVRDPGTVIEGTGTGRLSERKVERLEESEAARSEREKLRDEVVAYVKDVKHPLRLRELAAEVLGDYAVREKDPSVGDALAELAQRDPHSCYRGGPDGKPIALLFPVKRAAVEAIKKMQKAKLPLPSYVVRAVNVPIEQPLRNAAVSPR